MKGWVSHAIAFALGAVLCGAVVLWISHGAGAKLNADLTNLRASLAGAVADRADLAQQLRLVRLNDAEARLAWLATPPGIK